ncbi:MAG: Holliday junction resolvase RuvX [Clostridia bacterium]|nr:Holliday junction resolvase RuvX [Clostridia bacterium]
MKIMALDVGNKRIGVALSDELQILAQPLYTIHRKGIERDIEEIVKIINDNNVEEVIVGLPKNMDGTTGFQGEKTIKFAEVLRQSTDRPLIMWDERMTTISARRIMIENDVKQKDKKNLVDTIAAVVILETYLSRKNMERG